MKSVFGLEVHTHESESQGQAVGVARSVLSVSYGVTGNVEVDVVVLFFERGVL